MAKSRDKGKREAKKPKKDKKPKLAPSPFSSGINPTPRREPGPGAPTE
jgi:hypothetical protein